jgi:hypothetical protein
LGAPLDTTEHQIAAILDSQNFATRCKQASLNSGISEDCFRRHCSMPQKPRETHLAAAPAATKLAHTGARIAHHGPVQQGPPFLSRSSPNCPNP